MSSPPDPGGLFECLVSMIRSICEVGGVDADIHVEVCDYDLTLFLSFPCAPCIIANGKEYAKFAQTFFV
ncbi:hypothetical protein K503DRAFT_776992 [Rhizopogon vinicolor AM-OR11-026]|uniref:Uncharacterized protein n=1 Tax=Rhizopogon vinicolor AM-OR11-026 TaxID=1314800 RepID=A0A1B7MHM2_9AGAM|nr:hypothetical protein K503DRAFT_776992 [Rhizopogon vinicolor AM-OR11-026]